MKTTIMTVSNLRPNDVLARTGERVVQAYADSKTQRGCRTVVLARGEFSRKVEWNAGTRISIHA